MSVLFRVSVLSFVLSGCQEPFPEDRHDLQSFRIAAINATPTLTGLSLRAFVYSGEGMYHTTPPTLEWTIGDLLATGPQVDVTVSLPTTVTLRATHADGRTEDAVLDVPADLEVPAVAGFSRGPTSLTIDDIAQSVDARAAVTPEADGPTDPGGGLRLSVDAPDDTTTHWMGTDGQFAELSAHETDWFAGTATIDDGEVEEKDEISEGIYPLVALTFDGQGGNTWTWIDAAVGIDPPYLLVGGRIFPITEPLSGDGYFSATLQADDSLTGFALTDVAVAADAASAPALCGQPASTPFDPAVIAEGWCGLDEMIGQQVIFLGTAVP